MPINPYIDLFGTGAAGGSAAAAGATGGGLPWHIILPIALSFFSSTFGGGDDPEVEAILRKLEMQRTMQGLESLGMRKPYRSPHIEGLDKVTVQAILNQLGRSKNWGWPAGKGLDLNFLNEFLSSGLGSTGDGIRRI